LAKWLGWLFAVINRGIGMKFTVAISFCLTFAYLANLIGLAPIVGAFAAGLVLEAVHFKYFQNFEGNIRFPEGFKPESLFIKATPKSKKIPRVEKTYPWIEIMTRGHVTNAG